MTEVNFQDRGSQYRTAIFYHNDSQKQAAEETKLEVAESGRFKKPIVTSILPASTFYEAEEYHQDFHKKIQSIIKKTALSLVEMNLFKRTGNNSCVQNKAA